MRGAPKTESRDLAHWVILVAGVVYAVGVGLLALGVYVDLPGFLSAYGDPEAWWPIAVNLTAGLVSFGTWRWVNRRNSRHLHSLRAIHRVEILRRLSDARILHGPVRIAGRATLQWPAGISACGNVDE